jgi:hypothetical protein
MEPIETNEPQIPGETIGMILTEEAQLFLYQSGKWARFLGIMGFIGSAFIAIVGIFFGTFMSLVANLKQQQVQYMPVGFSTVVAVFYILIGLLCFYVSLKLYQFGSGINDGIEWRNTEQVTKALGKLKSFFKIKGIILVCILSLYVLIIIGAIFAGIVGASMMSR